MAEDKKEPWLNHLALTTIILAVCATLATFKGGSFSTRSILYQSQAADQWAFYQSKSIKKYLYELQKEKIAVDLSVNEALTPTAKNIYQEKIAQYEAMIGKFADEKNSISKEAKRFEAQRDEAQKHSQIFGIAVIFLQIAILLSSIAALMKRKILWYIGMLIGLGGIINFINGFLRLF
jgi:hypothetical protein